MKLSPKEISTLINNTPPYQRQTVRDDYFGVEINCEVEFTSIDKISEDCYKVRCFDYNSKMLVSFDIDIKKYPEFKFLKKNTLIKVSGIIVRISDLSIDIKDTIFIDTNKSSQLPTEKSEHVSDLSTPVFKDEKKSNHKKPFIYFLLKNYKKILSIISIITALLGSKYVINLNYSSVGTNNTSSYNQKGGITAGGNVTINTLATSSKINKVDIENTPSVFDLIEKLNKFDTSLMKGDYLRRIIGSEVGGSANIYDIKNGVKDNTFFIFLNKGNAIVMCKTSAEESKLPIIRKVGSLISFKGQIESSDLDFVLTNCVFQ